MLVEPLLPGDLVPGHDPAAPRQDTWQPDPGADLRDGRGLHELLYEDGDLRRPRSWSAPSTNRLVAQTIDELEARPDALAPGDTIEVMDYGTGTGLAAIELLKVCRDRDFEARLAQREATLALHLVDIPSSWFAQGHALLRDCTWTRFHHLTDANGFRALPDVLDGRRMDIVMSSMVFHLIPPRALVRVAEGLGDVTKPGGRLLWSAPDLGPPGPESVLFHDPNRAVRERWRAFVSGTSQPNSAVLQEAVAHARRRRSESDSLTLDDRADRRILRRAHTGTEIAEALSRRFAGTIDTADYEMTTDESLDTLLVPSNQEEYLPEVDDPATRAAVIEELLLGEVLPEMHAGPAATPNGLNIRWTFGDFSPRGG
jgi:ubiquinone/menaquinone biosynthesis C-methylase UbiE